MNGLFIAEDLPDIFPSKEKEHEAYITAKKKLIRELKVKELRNLIRNISYGWCNK